MLASLLVGNPSQRTATCEVPGTCTSTAKCVSRARVRLIARRLKDPAGIPLRPRSAANPPCALGPIAVVGLRYANSLCMLRLLGAAKSNRDLGPEEIPPW